MKALIYLQVNVWILQSRLNGIMSIANQMFPHLTNLIKVLDLVEYLKKNISKINTFQRGSELQNTDHHLNTRPFDYRTQIYHLNTRPIQYSDGLSNQCKKVWFAKARFLNGGRNGVHKPDQLDNTGPVYKGSII